VAHNACSYHGEERSDEAIFSRIVSSLVKYGAGSDGDSMRLAALTCRSFYSLLRASVSVLRWVEKAAAYGYGAVALADVNSMSGVVDLCQAAEKMDVRPIVGVEILTDSHRAILLAEDDRGYGNLCRITTARNLMPDFDLVEQLKVHHEGVVCICSQRGLVGKLKGLFSRDSLFAGCRDSKEAESAVARGVEPIAWTGVNWLEKEDIETAKLLARIRQLTMSLRGAQRSNLSPMEGRLPRCARNDMPQCNSEIASYRRSLGAGRRRRAALAAV
jgi:hypothetical protein